MAAVCAVTLRAIFYILAVLCCFSVSKPRFITPDEISITFGYDDMGSVEENFICGSLHDVNTQKKVFNSRYSGSSYLLLLLLMSGDVELCPGPCGDDMSNFYNCKGLKIVHQNVRGLLTNLPLLETFVSTTKSKIDIIRYFPVREIYVTLQGKKMTWILTI